MTRRRWVAAALTLAVICTAAAVIWWRFGRPVTVDVVPIVDGPVALRVEGPGTVQARVAVTLATRIAATVTAVNADVGDETAAGQVLVELDDRDLRARRDGITAQRQTQARNIEAARAALRKAQADVALARSRARRDADLQREGFVSTAGLEDVRSALDVATAAEQSARAALAARESEHAASAHDLEAARVAETHARLRSPGHMLVVQRLVEPGTTVTAGMALLQLVDPATLWVAMRVDEARLAALRPGQPAQIRLRSGAEFEGHVARIARQSDAATREIDVHVAFDAVPQGLALDQQAAVTVLAGEQRGLRIPATALVHHRDGRPGVLEVVDGRARFVPVSTGATDGAQLLLSEGPEAGTMVVAQPQGVRDGARVRATN